MDLFQQKASNETVLSAEAEESCFMLAARLRPMSSVEICQRNHSNHLDISPMLYSKGVF